MATLLVSGVKFLDLFVLHRDLIEQNIIQILSYELNILLFCDINHKCFMMRMSTIDHIRSYGMSTLSNF